MPEPPASTPDDAPPDATESAAQQPDAPPAEPGRRRLRGTGAGFGHTDDPGSMAAEFARRVREAAEQRRPAIERGAQDALERVRQLADASKPQFERLAGQAKQAADAARPRVEQAARDAAAYASEHEAELRAAAARAAQVAGRAVVPPALRPIVDAAGAELRREPRPPAEAPEPAGDAPGDKPT